MRGSISTWVRIRVVPATIARSSTRAPRWIDILDGKIAFHGGDRLDRLGDVAVMVPAAAEQAGLVQVDVGVDKARQHQPAID